MNAIPTEILLLAQSKILQQGRTPLSPCQLDDGGSIRLCAAAAVASAGLEREDGAVVAKAFAKDLARTSDMNLVRDIFDRFGWGRSTADQMLQFNDALEEDLRTEKVARMLGAWIP